MLLQSGSQEGDESQRDRAHLRDPALMRRWYADLALALRRAHQASGGRRVVLHVEPDLWGYVQRAAGGDDAGTVPAAVASPAATRGCAACPTPPPAWRARSCDCATAWRRRSRSAGT